MLQKPREALALVHGMPTALKDPRLIAVQFLDGLLAKQIQGKLQAQQLLALVAHYQRDDVLKALERAVRFGAFSLADQTIHDRVRFYAKFSLLIIDEFGFDRTERAVYPEAASLWYKIIDARSHRCSTALVTNIDFESWADYLGDAPLAMAMLDRVVDGATIVKLKGKSYRVHRGGDEPPDQ